MASGVRRRDPRHRTRRGTRRSAANTCLRLHVDIYRAIADRTRRTILDELVDRSGQSLFELGARLIMKHGINSSRQAISQHLDVLEAAGLIRTTPQSVHSGLRLLRTGSPVPASRSMTSKPSTSVSWEEACDSFSRQQTSGASSARSLTIHAAT